MTAQNLNTNTYVIDASATSQYVTLSNMDKNTNSMIVYNGTTQDCFVVSGETAPTVVFPTSSNDPLRGKVIGAGMMVTFTKLTNHGFVGAIQATAGTGSLYISVGAGE